MCLGISVCILGVYAHGNHVPFDAFLKGALPVVLAVRTAAVSDEAAWREVAVTMFSSVDSVFALCAFSDDALVSALDAALGSDDSGVDSVTLALAALVVVEAALGKIC